jgi:soluble lytic murein transglycosylase
MQAVLRLSLVLMVAICASPARAAPQTLEEFRKLFLQAEQLISQNRDQEYLEQAFMLKGYVLYPYLHYQWLKKNLDDEDAVETFLFEYPQSRYAQALRMKWLAYLGKSQLWSAFLEQYRNTDDLELQCYAALAAYHTGETASALSKAGQLWLNGKTLPAACDSLFDLLKAAPGFTAELVWQRFHEALRLDNQQLASQLSRLLPEAEQADAELWLKLHRQPPLVMQAADWKKLYPQAGSLFVYAINRWLDADVQAALPVWDAEKTSFSLPRQLVSDTENHLAVELALNHDSRAYDRLAQLPEKEVVGREWQVRAALYQQNWQQVNAAINALTEEERQQDKWRYWQARAWATTGNETAAVDIFKQLASKRSFYGFLAANRLNQKIAVPDQPLQVELADIQQVRAQEEFQVVFELLALNRMTEAKKQWWFALAGLPKSSLPTAAKLAQQWQLPAVAIFTIAKANAWDDMDLRFPILYTALVQAAASTSELDPAVIYGLIRQESAFDEQAESPVGAKGLMQLMPKTGQQLAEELKQGWKGENSLFDTELNIRYGSLYYKKLLRQFNGKHVLSAAAYNAGANRVKRWLPENQSLPGDIWVETIPYKETRNYVSSVLQYTLIYQERLHRDTLKLEILTPEINATKN